MVSKYEFIQSLTRSAKAVGRWFAYNVDFDITITEAELFEELQFRG